MTTISRITARWSLAALQHDIDQHSKYYDELLYHCNEPSTQQSISTHCSSGTVGISTNRNLASSDHTTSPNIQLIATSNQLRTALYHAFLYFL